LNDYDRGVRERIDREAKRELFDAFAVVGRAVASGRRVEILDVLANGERGVEALAGELGLSVANTSQHLQILRQAGLVASRRRGTSVIYRLASPEVFEFLGGLRALAAERIGDVDRLADAYLGRRDTEPPISRSELRRRMRSGDVVVLDVRPAEEFAAGHLPGALSAPLEELPRAVRMLPKEREIVVYCRGRFCAYSHVAVDLLRRRGFVARRLEEGLPEWAAERLPVERTPATAIPEASVSDAVTATVSRRPRGSARTPTSEPPTTKPASRQKR
jgi:rhodanese-related sulfurtransferase/DNA-binding transcriptional ArsR family regulator